VIEFSLEPVDNQRLANLCGVLDENLRCIESALSISIARRGEHFTLEGEEQFTQHGVKVIERFYARAGKRLSGGDIQMGLVELLNDDAALAAPTLVTKRSDLRARTPRQATYLNQIRSHDITLGIGPAGTGKTYLAVASAVDALERDAVRRIVLVRPAVEAGERL